MSELIGSPAPAFELYSQHRELVSSESLAGRKSLIAFIPFPFTPTCDGEACAMRDGLGSLEALDANVVVITTHAVPTNAKWADENGFTFPILSDYWPHGAAAMSYGVLNERMGIA
ncbi:MAG: redoxin domain-containing protein, partial [Acidimicrobiia bacterium]